MLKLVVRHGGKVRAVPTFDLYDIICIDIEAFLFLYIFFRFLTIVFLFFILFFFLGKRGSTVRARP